MSGFAAAAARTEDGEMKAKLGVCDCCLPGSGNFSLELASEAGLDGISLEFGPANKGFPLSRRRLQDAFLEKKKQCGIEFCNITMSAFDLTPFPVHRGHAGYDMVREALNDAVSAAAHMNIPLVMVPTFEASEIADEDRFHNAVGMFRYICPIARDKGVKIASESVMSPERQMRLCDEVGFDNFGLFYDNDNFFYRKGWDPATVLDALYDRLLPQLHVKDGKRGVLAGSPLGEGDGGFRDVVAYLEKRNFEGWIIIENLYEELPLRALNEDVWLTFNKDVETLKRAIGR